jgi:transposase-like protein
VTCVGWYCRFSLSLRDLKELMAERGLPVDHATIWRWVQRYEPEIHRRLRGHLKRKSPTWHMDETFVRAAGRCITSVGNLIMKHHDRPELESASNLPSLGEIT